MKSAPGLSRAGIDLRGQAQIARSIAIADMQNERRGTAAGDVKQLLQGRAGANVISTPALTGQIGKDIAKAAKSGKMKQAVKLLNKALTPSPELLKAYENSMEGMTNTARDSLTPPAHGFSTCSPRGSLLSLQLPNSGHGLTAAPAVSRRARPDESCPPS